MPAATIDTSVLEIGPVAISGKGAKSAPISLPGDKPVYWRPAKALIACYEPAAYQNAEATRVNLTLRTLTEHIEDLQKLDAWCLDYVAKNCERLLGSTVTPSQLQERYQPILKVSEKYPTSIRVKMNLEGFSAPKFWTDDGKLCPPPKTWQGSMVWPRVRVKGIWFMSKQFGVLLELTDAKVREVECECPFDE